MHVNCRKGKFMSTDNKVTGESGYKKIKRNIRKILSLSDNKKADKKIAQEVMQEDPFEKEKALLAGRDKNHVWAFVAGNTSQDFRGNPKYLFVYINKYRPDIFAYWYCREEETLEQVRALGFHAFSSEEANTQYLLEHTGVLVAEQVKLEIPAGMTDLKYLNLWHGVGFKRIERRLFTGDIAIDIAWKYVKNGTFYRDHQLLTVTSPMIEEEFGLDCGVDSDKFVRSGYLRCLYQQNYEPICTFDHDLRKIKGLPESTRMIVYAPTYRADLGGTFGAAITDIEALYQCCEKNNVLLIFKVHPYMEQEAEFLYAGEKYKDKPYFWFWDNKDDFYEVMDQVDMAIVDYSSIVTDMVAVGIKHYIRYIFDFENYIGDGLTQGADEYYERTLGTICYSFDELLKAIDTYEEQDMTEDIARMNEKFWSYSKGKDDFENVIAQTMDFKIVERKFPTLYSFDVFDTLISRKVLDPFGIFFYVQEKMYQDGSFPFSLVRNYPSMRHTCETNVRELYRKTQESRNSDHVEITFDEIFDRMVDVYGITPEQVQKLKDWELEAELDNVIPLKPQIDMLKTYVERGEKVILISDMYLSKEMITKMLEKADPILATIPLFVSNEYGVMKNTRKLFFEVYKTFEPYYDFEKWIHYGDNRVADQNQPRRFGIKTRRVIKPEFSNMQQQLVDQMGTYDSYLVAAMQTRLCTQNTYEKDSFVVSFISLCMVPYIDWVLRDALKRGYKTLYFISRDGHPLKRIADAMIEAKNLPLKTKYIYASRRAWRIPSFIHEIDPAFYQGNGNFTDIISKEKLFRAMDLDEETFYKFFPTINADEIDYTDKEQMCQYVEIFKNSVEYNEYLLQQAARERVLVSGYLKQEIDANEPFAMVEYWGRGYTQDNFKNLWQDLVGEDADAPFYYCRSILPTQGHSIRHNFITHDGPLLFMEGIFANMPYKSVESYEMKDGKIVPVIVPTDYDKNLFASMQTLLPEVARQYSMLPLLHPEDTSRMLQEFALNYYKDNVDNIEFANQMGPLVDAVAVFGNKREFAPPYTMETLEQFEENIITRGRMTLTSSISMSVVRSEKDVQEKYFEMYQIFPGDNVAGGRLLTPDEIETNCSYKKKYEELKKISVSFKDAYKEQVQEVSVQKNKVLIVMNKKKKELPIGMKLLYEQLCKNAEIAASVIWMSEEMQDLEAVAKEIAMARCILIQEPIEAFCELFFRDETKVILMPESPFAMKNQGRAVNYFLKWRQMYSQYLSSKDVSVVQIPSKQQKEIMQKEYGSNNQTAYDLIGCNLTDIYYDEEYKAAARQKIIELFPEAADKKIITYIPKIRMLKKEMQWADLLDMQALAKELGDEYVVLIHISPKDRKLKILNELEVPGFSKNFPKKLLMREMMVASDVIVGDYRDAFFESCMVRKPVYSTAYDYEKEIQAWNMTLNAMRFEELLFCPIVKSSFELAEQIRKQDSFDYSKMDAFREKYFDGCDGHAVERAVNYIKDILEEKIS